MFARTEFTIPPDQPTIVLKRTFDAPRRLVWEASTRPEHVERWFGFRGTTLSECRIDLRPGGAWRFVLRMHDGTEHGFGGVYREIVPFERLVFTFAYDGAPQAEAVETITLEDWQGKTLMTTEVRHTSLANRDAQVAAGMEVGARESDDRLAELLETLKPAATR